MQALPDEVLALHDGADVLINNAGVGVGAIFATHSIDDASGSSGVLRAEQILGRW